MKTLNSIRTNVETYLRQHPMGAVGISIAVGVLVVFFIVFLRAILFGIVIGTITSVIMTKKGWYKHELLALVPIGLAFGVEYMLFSHHALFALVAGVFSFLSWKLTVK